MVTSCHAHYRYIQIPIWSICKFYSYLSLLYLSVRDASRRVVYDIERYRIKWTRTLPLLWSLNVYTWYWIFTDFVLFEFVIIKKTWRRNTFVSWDWDSRIFRNLKVEFTIFYSLYRWVLYRWNYDFFFQCNNQKPCLKNVTKKIDAKNKNLCILSSPRSIFLDKFLVFKGFF